jgi:hypothetical protein
MNAFKFRDTRKGMALPTSMLALAAIVVMVLIAAVSFFFFVGGGAISRTELESTFRTNCLTICSDPNRMTANLAAQYPEWQSACEQLHGVEKGAYLQCLDRCGSGCLVPGDACDYLCTFRTVLDDWPGFCERVRTHPTTAATYARCDCSCPQG